jgi:hypothetical protein
MDAGGRFLIYSISKTFTAVCVLHPPAITPSYGLGIAGDPDGSLGASYGHDGAGPGYVLSASTVVGHQMGPVGVAVCCNASPASGVTALGQSLLRIVVTAT